MNTVHIPVLLNEVLEYLNPQSGQNFIDGTFGGGGHSLAILERIKPNGKLLAIDANFDVIKSIKANKNIIFVHNNFRNLDKIVAKNFPYSVNGILLDLGLSSDELETSGRGFSFQKDEPLDMRFDIKKDLTAEEIINTYSLENLINIFKNFGEYTYSKKLAQLLVQTRKQYKIKTTSDLVALILQITPHKNQEKIHPATQVFQALRMAVNDELKSLKIVLSQAIEILASGGRLVIISFHSLEDGLVKNYFRDLSRQDQPRIKIITKKPVGPTEQEIFGNPRCRSAKMRIIEKL